MFAILINKHGSARASAPLRVVAAASGRSMALILLATAALASGCKGSQAPQSGSAASATSIPAAAAAAPDASPTGTEAKPTAASETSALAARSGELTNPDNPTMVFLYYDLAGIAPPIDQWVEKDGRVAYARGPDKAAQRAAVKAELQAGMAAVRGVGVINLTTNANLSAYDPTYGEFTVGALSPGSAFTFQALGQNVTMKFDNGLKAQSWSVPKDQAQAITDKIGNDNVMLDTALKVDKVLPGPGGGTIVTRIVSWNLRDTRDGTTVGRMQVPES